MQFINLPLKGTSNDVGVDERSAGYDWGAFIKAACCVKQRYYTKVVILGHWFVGIQE